MVGRRPPAAQATLVYGNPGFLPVLGRGDGSTDQSASTSPTTASSTCGSPTARRCPSPSATAATGSPSRATRTATAARPRASSTADRPGRACGERSSCPARSTNGTCRAPQAVGKKPAPSAERPDGSPAGTPEGTAPRTFVEVAHRARGRRQGQAHARPVFVLEFWHRTHSYAGPGGFAGRACLSQAADHPHHHHTHRAHHPSPHHDRPMIVFSARKTFNFPLGAQDGIHRARIRQTATDST